VGAATPLSRAKAVSSWKDEVEAWKASTTVFNGEVPEGGLLEILSPSDPFLLTHSVFSGEHRRKAIDDSDDLMPEDLRLAEALVDQKAYGQRQIFGAAPISACLR